MSAVRLEDAVATGRPDLRLRSPSDVMRLSRLGAFHQTRLSFARVLLRRAADEGWQFDRPLWRIDALGEGVAVYRVRTRGHVYCLVAFGHDLPADKRSDRVIADAWDATFALHDGDISPADIDRLSRNVPLQEAGRLSARELTLSRANRSVRLFDEVVSQLSAGRQPAAAALDAVGYLMRTTAVYGGGKFGLSDRERIAERPEFAGPFGAEMLTVWLIRAFTTDLVEHLAACRAPDLAVPLDPLLKRRLGVGNSTGLGMAPFIVHHAGLLHRWIQARETALARVLALPGGTADDFETLAGLLRETIEDVAGWSVPDPLQSNRNAGLLDDLRRLEQHLAAHPLDGKLSLRDLFAFAQAELGVEAEEMLVTLLLEPHGAIVDDLVSEMAGDETTERRIDGASTLGDLGRALATHYDFAAAPVVPGSRGEALFWYVSQDKLEPRLGLRAEEAGADREQPLAIARDAAMLRRLVEAASPHESVASFLLRHPEARQIVRRVQLTEHRPYAEIRDNLIDAALRPIDLLRCKLSFFGATKFDPKSDRWVRISLFAKAAFPDEICVAFEAPPSTAEPMRPTPGSDEAIVLSLNEIDAELRKAARGAGLAWGEAEEIGRAARWSAAAGLDLLPVFADALDAHRAGTLGRPILEGTMWRSMDERPLSPLTLGIALLDHAALLGAGAAFTCRDVAAASLLLPSLAEVSLRLERGLRLTAVGRNVRVAPGASGPEVAQWLGMGRLEALGIAIDTAVPVPAALIPAPFGGFAASLPVWDRIGSLAKLTYVPSSVRSRLTGAGSGTAGAEHD